MDLFAIEHQSRDSQLLASGNDGTNGTPDDLMLVNRFNVDDDFVALGAEQFFDTWPESYGFVTGKDLDSRSRGIATLPVEFLCTKRPPSMAHPTVSTW